MGKINRKRQDVLSFYLKINVDFRNVLKDLKGANLAVFMTIALHMNSEMKSYPSINRISELTGYDRKTVIKSIRYLESLGFIEKEKRYHKSTLYIVKAFIYPLYQSGDSPLLNNNQNGNNPLSSNQSGQDGRVPFPTEDNTSFYKKTTTTEDVVRLSDSIFFNRIEGSTLKDLVCRYGPEKVHYTIDMLDWQYQRSRKVIDNPDTLLENALRVEYRPPKGWIPKKIRKVLEQKESLAKKIENEHNMKEKEKTMVTAQKIKALSEFDYKALRESAISALPPVLRNIEILIEAKMRELHDNAA
jgi:predicted transcriptional regulator